jgi:leucyl-tRNA synthetase
MYVFTTRADTIMGVTFCAVAPEHPLAAHAAAGNPALAAFIEECQQGGTTEAELAGRQARHRHRPDRHPPLRPAPRCPLWIANFVLMELRHRRDLRLPGHDERDFDFAKKYGLPVIRP